MGRLFFLACAASALVFGCSDGATLPDAGGDPDAGSPPDDAGSPRDGGRRDASLRRDGGTGRDGGNCGPGMHMCLSGCEPDRPNVPEEGCRLGCGNPCDAPVGGTAMCDSDGDCVAGCEPPGVIDGDRCCGGPLVCSAGIMSLLACPAPSEEPNETSLTPRQLGTYDDESDSSEGIMRLALPVGDEDWFRINVTDGCCSISTLVSVTVRPSTAGDVELSAWFACASGDEVGSCTGGTSDSTHGLGCITPVTGTSARIDFDNDCSGTIDENGTVLVRVRPTSSAMMCSEYELDFEVRS